MTSLVVFDTKAHTYKIFENNKCIAEYIVENKEPLPKEVVEEMRVANYTAA